MNTLKKIFTLLLILNSFLNYAQQPFREISGTVLDEKKQPIEFANVFVNNTSIGTATDAKGSFKLKIPNNIPNIEMIVSFAGFEKIKEKISLTDTSKKNFTFKLKSILINEVRVTAKRDKNYKREWEIFKNTLLGQSVFAKDCEILNADNLRFEEDADGSLLITAPEPFYVLNKALGYKIRVEMPFFKYNEKNWMSITDQFFEKVMPIDLNQEMLWKKNRITAFENSLRNFLVSVAKGDLEKHNFILFQRNIKSKEYSDVATVKEEMAKKNITPLKISEFYFYDNQKSVNTLFSNKDIIVFLKNEPEQNPVFADYPYKYASIELPLKSMIFDKNGWIIKRNAMTLGGLWATEGVSVYLPIDFTVE